MITWKISPNWLAWTLLAISTISIASIAVRMWYTPKNGVKWHDISKSSHTHYLVGELYKTTILTVWLTSSIWLMWKVYNNPILSGCENFWSNLIAIIGIIIATLIGWQIYASMDWGAKLTQISSIESRVSLIDADFRKGEALNRAHIDFLQALLMWSHRNRDPSGDAENLPNIFRLLLSALNGYLIAMEHIPIGSCIENLGTLIEQMETLPTINNTEWLRTECGKLFDSIAERQRFLSPDQSSRILSFKTTWDRIMGKTPTP